MKSGCGRARIRGAFGAVLDLGFQIPDLKDRPCGHLTKPGNRGFYTAPAGARRVGANPILRLLVRDQTRLKRYRNRGSMADDVVDIIF